MVAVISEQPVKQWVDYEAEEASNNALWQGLMLDEVREGMKKMAEAVSEASASAEMNTDTLVAKPEASDSEKTPDLGRASTAKTEHLGADIAEKVTTLLRTGVDAEIVAEVFGENLTSVAGQMVREKIAEKKQREKLEHVIAMEASREVTRQAAEQAQNSQRQQETATRILESNIRDITSRLTATQQQPNLQSQQVQQQIQQSQIVRENIVRQQQQVAQTSRLQVEQNINRAALDSQRISNQVRNSVEINTAVRESVRTSEQARMNVEVQRSQQRSSEVQQQTSVRENAQQQQRSTEQARNQQQQVEARQTQQRVTEAARTNVEVQQAVQRSQQVNETIIQANREQQVSGNVQNVAAERLNAMRAHDIGNRQQQQNQQIPEIIRNQPTIQPTSRLPEQLTPRAEVQPVPEIVRNPVSRTPEVPKIDPIIKQPVQPIRTAPEPIATKIPVTTPVPKIKPEPVITGGGKNPEYIDKPTPTPSDRGAEIIKLNAEDRLRMIREQREVIAQKPPTYTSQPTICGGCGGPCAGCPMKGAHATASNVGASAGRSA